MKNLNVPKDPQGHEIIRNFCQLLETRDCSLQEVINFQSKMLGREWYTGCNQMMLKLLIDTTVEKMIGTIDTDSLVSSETKVSCLKRQVLIFSNMIEDSSEVSDLIIDCFLTKVLSNSQLRFSATHLIMFYALVSQSKSLRQHAKIKGLITKMFLSLTIFLEDSNESAHKLMQIDDLQMTDLWNNVALDTSDMENDQQKQGHKQNFNLNLQDFFQKNHVDGGPDTGGLRSQFYRGGPSQSRRLTQMTQPPDAISISGPAHYKSLDGREGQVIPEVDDQSPTLPMQPPHQPSGQHEVQLLGSQGDSGRTGPISGPHQVGQTGHSPLILSDMQGNNSSSNNRKISQTAIQELNFRQNIHKIGQFNKMSFARAASEPPQQVTHGILNSKSIILPVQEEIEPKDEIHNGLVAQQKSIDSLDQPGQQNLNPADDHLNQQITQNDLRNSQVRTQKFHKNLTNSHELNLSHQSKKRNSSSFIMNTFFNLYSQQRQCEQFQQQLVAHNQMSALSAFSGHVSHLSDNNRNNSQLGTPGPNARGATNYQILPQQNQLAMTRLSRRQLSYGQSQLSRGEKTAKMKTASNQVIAAYGDPRDTRFTGPTNGAQSAQANGPQGAVNRPSEQISVNDQQNLNQTTMRERDSLDQDPNRETSESEETPRISENQDTIVEDSNRDNLEQDNKSPLIPKLNLLNIHQDPKGGKHKLDSSMGQQNILATAGAPGLLATPGQPQNLNSVALVQIVPPLTSHYPIITSCSPGKRANTGAGGENQILMHMDTSNRNSAIIPIHMRSVGAPQRMLTSFTNPIRANQGLIGKINNQNYSADENRDLPSNEGDIGKQLLHMPQQKVGKNRHAQSFKQQRNNLMLKLQQLQTNNSDINRGGTGPNTDKDEQNLLNAVISEAANATNTSAGINQRSNSLKILDGMAQSTINPLGYTQASNIIGMNLDSGVIHNMGGGALLITNQDGQIIGNNSITKIGEIATQLGEAYLTKDLAFLISQQRDMELEDQAKQTVLKFEYDEIKAQKQQQPSGRSKSMFINSESVLLAIKRSASCKQSHISSFRALKQKVEVQSDQKMSRLIMLNIIWQLLGEYSQEEMRLLNFQQPLQLFQRYLQSRQYQLNRVEKDVGKIIQQIEYQTRIEKYSYSLVEESEQIMMILSAFAFGNEDIMRQFIQSRFKNYVDRDNYQKHLNSDLESKEQTPLKSIQNRQLQNEHNQEQFFRHNRISALSQGGNYNQNFGDDMQMMSPSVNHKGQTSINMQATMGLYIPREIFARKIDILLYTSSQTIKNLVVRQVQEAQPENLWSGDSMFPQSLTKQISMLSAYIGGANSVQSRVLLQQFIDVCMESMLLIKRVLVDVTHRQKLFIIDQTKQILPFVQQELIYRGRIIGDQLVIQDVQSNNNGDQPSPPPQNGNSTDNLTGYMAYQYSIQTELQAQRAIIQMCFRQLFGEFLDLLTVVLKLPQTPDSMKLLNETFLCNSQWQETVKNFSISMWLQDVVSPVLIGFHFEHQAQAQAKNKSHILSVDQKCIIYENLESLRGINILNYNQKDFSRQINFISSQATIMTQNEEPNLKQISNQQISLLMMQLVQIMSYYEGVIKLFKKAIDIFFPVTLSAPQKRDENQEQQEYDLMNSYINRSNTRNTRNMQNMTNETSSRNIGANNADNSFYTEGPRGGYGPNFQPSAPGGEFSGRIGTPNPFITTGSAEQKYWKRSIRQSLFQMSFWFTNTNGLMNQYLQINASNYKAVKTNKLQNLDEYNCPLNYALTLHSLGFLDEIFNLNEKFTKYTFIKEIVVFYVRTFQTNFVRLYNKNKKYMQQLSKLEKDDLTFNKIVLNQQNSLELCKHHLRCLFGLTKNRTEDTRQMLFQFQIVSFLTQELSLENDYLQTRQKLYATSKKIAKEANAADFEFQELDSPDKIKRDGMMSQDGRRDDQADEERSDHAQPRETGYILDPIQTDNNQIREEIQRKLDDSNKMYGNKGLQLNNQQQQNLSPTPERYSSDSNDGLPPPIPPPKSKKFAFKLKVDGLTHSTLAQGNGQTAEQMADAQVLKQSMQQKQQVQDSYSNRSEEAQIPMQSQQSQPNFDQTENVYTFADEDSSDGLPPPLPVKSKPVFKLAIGGLGLSTLAKVDGGKTAEELADLEQVKISQNQNKQIRNVQVSDSNPPNNSMMPPHNILKNDKITEESSDSDDGLPPPVPQFKKQVLPKLAIGGLGLSTLAKGNDKTAEQLADEQTLKFSIKQKNAPIPESDDDSSDDGLPPPIPQGQKFQMPKLAIGGLGLSTLSNSNNGMTPEQMSDMQALKNSQNQQKLPQIQESSDSEEDVEIRNQVQQPPVQPYEQHNKVENDSDSSDDGLPPPIPQKKVFGMPALKIGGLGLSTITNNADGKTSEQIADAQALQNSKLQANQKQIAESSGESSDSDDGLPPPIPKQSNPIMPKLQIKGLGLSTVAKDGDQTAEQKADAQLYQEGLNAKNQQLQSQPSSSSSDDGLPPMIPPTRSFAMPKLQIGGLGLSTVKKDGDKMTQEEMADAQCLKAVLEQKKNQEVDSQSSSNYSDQMEGGDKQQEEQKQQSSSQRSLGSNRKKFNTIDKIEQERIFQSRNQAINQATQPINTSQQNKIPSNKSKGDIIGKMSTGNKINIKKQPIKLVGKPQQQVNHQKLATPKKLQPTTKLPKKESSRADDKPKNLILLQKKRDLKEEPQMPQQNKGDNNALIFSHKNSTQNLGVQFEERMPQDEEKIPPVSHLFEVIDGQPAEPSLEADLRVVTTPKKLINKPKSFQKPRKRKAIKISRDDFYQNERQKRPVYCDKELHCLMLGLILSLLIQPQRGTLDDLYCLQFPELEGKQNYLYILHQHLSHEQNQHIIKKLLGMMNEIQPPLAGQRLLKLMCPQLFDLSLYNNGKDWKKLASGAYGVVYESQTNLVHPKSVAIKQMDLPSGISERCVLHDIFTEITCLEEFRLEKCVTDLYDYGVDRQAYYIVMKKYACSLGDWRRKQGDSIKVFRQNLSLYVSIYYKCLKALMTIHSHNVTHYDLKCDNVLISFDQEDMDPRYMTEDDFEITIGDFGECKIFQNEKEEFCTRTRGTDSIKSPEMLQLQIHTRKDHDRYDRRKAVGTNRLSDIWSAGCLFFELLTGEFLLYNPDWTWFYCRVVGPGLELFEKEKIEKIDNNQYILDFLKFILIRDHRLRPTIDKVIKRFEHIHAILCNYAGSSSPHVRGLQQDYGALPFEAIRSNTELQECLRQATVIANMEQQSLSTKKGAKKILSRILESLFLCSADYLDENIGTLIKLGITHILAVDDCSDEVNRRFEVMQIDDRNTFKSMPIVMDFVRMSTLYKGRLLFVESQRSNLVSEAILICLNHAFKTSTYETYTLIKSQNLFFSIEAKRLAVISQWNLHLQRIRHYLSTFPQFSCHCGGCLIILDRQYAQYKNIQRLVACSCPQKMSPGGASYMNESEIGQYNAGPQNHYQTCPCAANPFLSCGEYVEFLNRFYQAARTGKSGTHITLNPISHHNQLVWAYFDSSEFIICPNPQNVSIQHLEEKEPTIETKRSQGSSKRSGKAIVPKIPLGQALKQRNQRLGGQRMQFGSSGGASIQQPSDRQTNRASISRINMQDRQFAANLSLTADVNAVPAISKARLEQLRKMQSMPSLAANLGAGRGLSSNQSILGNTPEPVSSRMLPAKSAPAGDSAWAVYKCRVCNCWTYAYNANQNKYAVLLNNRLAGSNQGLLSEKKSGSFGMASSLATLERQYHLLREEYFKAFQQQSAPLSAHMPPQSMFAQYSKAQEAAVPADALHQNGMDPLHLNMNMVPPTLQQTAPAPEQDYCEGVRVPILKDIGLVLPI